MARTMGFPGLQEKFDEVLLAIMASGDVFKRTQLLHSITSDASKYGLNEQEVAELTKNSNNYFTRAVARKVIESPGTAQGYRIVPGTEGPVIKGEGVASNQNQNNEAYLHFPATLALSQHFDARIVSLPQHSSKKKWLNPDMFMLRRSPSHDLDVGSSENLKLLALVDNTPEYIVSSIELKYNLYAGGRGARLNALAEAVFNGAWANETWLAFYNEDDTKSRFDDWFDADALQYALTNGIGIMELICLDNIDASFDVTVHLEPVYRSRLSQVRGKSDLLVMMFEALSNMNNGLEPIFSEADNDVFAAMLILKQAHNNLVKQSGFTASMSNFSSVKTLSGLQGVNPETLARTMNSAKHYIISLLGTDLVAQNPNASVSDNMIVQEWLKYLREYSS